MVEHSESGKKAQSGFGNAMTGTGSSSADRSAPGGAADPRSGRLYVIKTVLLGEASVGKSSLVNRFVNERKLQTEPTIGAAFFTRKLVIGTNEVKFDIWDTAGQERFHSLAPMYYRNAKAIIIAYDITKSDTFERAKSLVSDVGSRTNAGVILTIIGTKSDLLSTKQREVEYEAALSYAKSIKASFFETSALSGLNVDEVFKDIGERYIESEVSNPQQSQYADNLGGDGIVNIDTHNISTPPYNQQRRMTCCYLL